MRHKGTQAPQREYVKLREAPLSVLRAAAELSAAKGWAPSLQEITDAVGLSARSNVLQHMRALEAAGLLERGAGPRAVRVTAAGRELLGGFGVSIGETTPNGDANERQDHKAAAERRDEPRTDDPVVRKQEPDPNSEAQRHWK